MQIYKTVMQDLPSRLFLILSQVLRLQLQLSPLPLLLLPRLCPSHLQLWEQVGVHLYFSQDKFLTCLLHPTPLPLFLLPSTQVLYLPSPIPMLQASLLAKQFHPD